MLHGHPFARSSRPEPSHEPARPGGADAVPRIVSRRAFTLIELLVVISIISLLISIMLPSLARSKEVTRRTICMANSRSQAVACDNYAVNNKDYFPPSLDDKGNWAWSFDLRASGAGVNPRPPLGVGLTLAGGYFDVQPSALHCPSLDTSSAPITPFHSMNVNIGNWWNSVGANWWFDTGYNSFRITIGYTYRAPSWWHTNLTNRFIRVGNRTPNFVVNADILDTRFGIRWGHREGYNFTRLDQSSTWRADPTFTFESIAGVTVDGHGNPVVDEVLFKKLENNN